MLDSYILPLIKIILILYLIHNTINNFKSLNSVSGLAKNKNIPTSKLVVILAGIFLLKFMMFEENDINK
jgi:hypothetical protein